MNFARDKAERDRIVSVIRLLNEREATRLLTMRVQGGYYARLLAPALGIQTNGKFLSAVSKEIYDFINPDQATPPAPPINRKPCDGCGGIGDTPKFLRWAKVARGEPITISVDESGKPATLHWLTPEMIVKEWFEPWSVDTSLKFKLIKRGKADIRGSFRPIDGPGGTRGMAWLPDQSVDFMEQGGDLSGDFVIDSADRWVTVEEVHETGEHEGGHCLGFPHTNNPADVMYPYATGRRRPHSLNDKRAKTTRYPKRAIAA